MRKSLIYFTALFAIINILGAEEAMARWEAKTCTSFSQLRSSKDRVITNPPVMLTQGATVSVLNSCENNLCRLGRPFRSDPNDDTFLDVYVRRSVRTQQGNNIIIIVPANQRCYDVDYSASDQSQY